MSDDGSVQGGEIIDAKPLKLELEAGEAKKTDNLELAVNLPASSTVFDSAADFDPKNPATFNSSTSVTIFDNLGNPVIATAFFIKTQAASGDQVTHKYQTKFIVDMILKKNNVKKLLINKVKVILNQLPWQKYINNM